MTIEVMTSVSQPPWENFSSVVMMRTVRQIVRPVRWTGRCFFQFGSVWRCRMKKRDMPSWDSEKVRKTLMEYMTMSVPIRPRE